MSTRDIILIPIIFGLVMIPTYIGYTILDEVGTGLTNQGYTRHSNFFADGLTGMGVFDTMMIAAVVGVGIGAIALAARVRTHPAFALLSLFLLAIFVSVTAWLAIAYYEIQQAPQFATAANAMDNFVVINNNLPIIVTVLGIMVIIALYAKPWHGSESTSL